MEVTNTVNYYPTELSADKIFITRAPVSKLTSVEHFQTFLPTFKFGATALSRTTFSILTLSTMTLSTMGLCKTLSITVWSTFMQNVVVLNVAFLLC